MKEEIYNSAIYTDIGKWIPYKDRRRKKAVYLFYLNERHDKNYSLNLIINSVPVFGILYKITGIS